jgi:hypothetical protein
VAKESQTRPTDEETLLATFQSEKQVCNLQKCRVRSRLTYIYIAATSVQTELVSVSALIRMYIVQMLLTFPPPTHQREIFFHIFNKRFHFRRIT